MNRFFVSTQHTKCELIRTVHMRTWSHLCSVWPKYGVSPCLCALCAPRTCVSRTNHLSLARANRTRTKHMLGTQLTATRRLQLPAGPGQSPAVLHTNRHADPFHCSSFVSMTPLASHMLPPCHPSKRRERQAPVGALHQHGEPGIVPANPLSRQAPTLPWVCTPPTRAPPPHI